MIYTITGRPRNGKSLYAIDYIEKKARAEGRPVFYSRIEGIKFAGWHALDDVKKWDDCPSGSIILFDEAHYDFPARTSTSSIPHHVLPLNTHGHKGFDLYFITQAPKFLDPNVRGLTQEHHHVVRHFGREKATIHRWDVIKDNPDNKIAKQDSIKAKFVYPKQRFGQYVSSADHNVVENVPFKYKLLYIIPVIIFASLFKVGYSWYVSLNNEKKPIQTIEKSDSIISPSSLPTSPQITNTSIEPVKLSYLEAYKPEIPDILASAPIYQANHSPTVAPQPSACLASRKRCVCYTQQATLYPSSEAFCRQVAAHGYFQDDLQPQPSQTVSAPLDELQSIQPISIPSNSVGLTSSTSPDAV